MAVGGDAGGGKDKDERKCSMSFKEARGIFLIPWRILLPV